MADDLLTAQEAADFLKVKKTTVYELVKRGDLPSTKIGKQLRIPRAALEGMTGGCPGPGPTPSPLCGRGAGRESSCADQGQLPGPDRQPRHRQRGQRGGGPPAPMRAATTA